MRDALESGQLVALFDDRVSLEGPPYHALYRNTDGTSHLTTFINWLQGCVDARDRVPTPE